MGNSVSLLAPQLDKQGDEDKSRQAHCNLYAEKAVRQSFNCVVLHLYLLFHLYIYVEPV